MDGIWPGRILEKVSVGNRAGAGAFQSRCAVLCQPADHFIDLSLCTSFSIRLIQQKMIDFSKIHLEYFVIVYSLTLPRIIDTEMPMEKCGDL